MGALVGISVRGCLQDRTMDDSKAAAAPKAHPSVSDSSQKMCPWSCLEAHSFESVLSLVIITVYRAQGWALENLVNFRNFMRLVSLLSS